MSLFPNDLVWSPADLFNNLMVIPNVIALFGLSALVVMEVKAASAHRKEEKALKRATREEE